MTPVKMNVAELQGAKHPVYVCLAPAEAERRWQRKGAIRESNERQKNFAIPIII
jgi:hypothetical protein